VVSRIVRKEVTEMWRDGRFRLSAIVIVGLTLVALAGGWRHAARIAAEHEAARQATREQWLNQKPKNPHSAAHYGVYAFKPQTALSAIDSGIDPYVGVAAWLEAHRQNEFRFRPAADRAAVQRFGDLNAAFVLQTLVPLMVILLGFGAFASEREDGTLRQLLSLGLSPARLAAGKAGGVALALASVLVPVAVLGAVAISWTSVSELWSMDWSRTLALMLVYTAWTALWIGVTLLVSMRSASSRTALVGLLTAWMAVTLIAPRLVSEMAARVHPTPSAAEFQQALDAELADRRGVEARLAERRRELYARHGVSSDEALPINFAGVSLQEGEEHANDVFDRHFGGLYDAFERQNRFAQLAGFLAPSLAVRALSMGVAGSDVHQHRHFAQAAETYRRSIQRAMNDDIARHQKRGEAYLAGADLWGSVPEFDYQAPALGWVLGEQARAVAALLTWCAVLAGVAFVVAARAAVRS
jgi:ABC-2 type transport system permease protein